MQEEVTQEENGSRKGGNRVREKKNKQRPRDMAAHTCNPSDGELRQEGRVQDHTPLYNEILLQIHFPRKNTVMAAFWLPLAPQARRPAGREEQSDSYGQEEAWLTLHNGSEEK